MTNFLHNLDFGWIMSDNHCLIHLTQGRRPQFRWELPVFLSPMYRNATGRVVFINQLLPPFLKPTNLKIKQGQVLIHLPVFGLMELDKSQEFHSHEKTLYYTLFQGGKGQSNQLPKMGTPALLLPIRFCARVIPTLWFSKTGLVLRSGQYGYGFCIFRDGYVIPIGLQDLQYTACIC